MRPRRLLILGLTLLAIVAVFGIASISTASNTVPGSRSSLSQSAITPNLIKPIECAAINIATQMIASATGTTSGTSANNLMIGGPGRQTINGAGGADCILGGGSNDTINGGPGTDVCIVSLTASVSACETTYRR